MRHPVWTKPRQEGLVPKHEVRASQGAESVFVYQAFSVDIAAPAIAHQTLVPPFRKGRMTWIKPSFAWMMYRAGWGQKPGQERILRIEISTQGFVWALRHSCLSSYVPARHGSREAWQGSLSESPVRIQWDPERDLKLNPLPWRTIQIGLGPSASNLYVDEWILAIEDYTSVAAAVQAALQSGDPERALGIIPVEEPLMLAEDIVNRIGAT